MSISIKDADSVATIAPELGGMVTAYWSNRKGDPIHWLWPVPDELIAMTPTPKGGSFILAPFSNRLRQGRFHFRGTSHRFEAHPDAGGEGQHGYASRRGWQVAEHAGSRAVLTLTVTDDGWPWPLELRQEFELRDGALWQSLSVTSLAKEPSPIGLGFHPFFTRSGGNRLEIAARRLYETDRDTRPTTSSRSLEGRQDIALDPLTIGRFLGEWDGSYRITFPSLNAALRVETDASLLPYVLLFCPPGRPIVCAEPVSHLSGAFELPEAEALGQGMRILEPGAALTIAMIMIPELNA